jgi:spore coat protein CotH
MFVLKLKLSNKRRKMYSRKKYYKFHAFFIIIFLFFQSASAQNPGDNIFTGIQVHTIKINFPQPDFWDSLTYYYDQGLEQYMAATVTLDGNKMDSIAVRLKGNASYSHPNNKKSLRLSFDEYREDQRWDGLKGVHLNNCWGDPAFLRDKVHLDFCRWAGVNAPRANYAVVYLNDEEWGFYSLVEHVDKKFLNTHYANKDGNLYKAVDAFPGNTNTGGTPGIPGTPGTPGTPGQTNMKYSDFQWHGSDDTSYYSYYEFKTDESANPWKDLVSLVNVINNSSDMATDLPKKINVNNFYRAVATDIFFGNMDSYIDSGRNFYLYYNSATGKFEWIVWDVSLSFGAYNGNAQDMKNLSITYTSNASQRPLIGKIYDNPALKKEYLTAFSKLYKEYFSASALFAHIDSIVEIIRPYVSQDPKKQYTIEQFEQNISSDITTTTGGGPDGPGGPGGGQNSSIPGVKSFISARQQSIDSQLKDLNIDNNTINPGDVVINEFMAQNTKTITDSNGQYEDWVELYNNTGNDIDISNWYLSDSYTQPSKWQFPANTIIPKNGFVLIWADEDSTQKGIHAMFKLSASGEQLILSKSDMTIMDSIKFGTQTSDISMARIPNGTGTFKTVSSPTPNSTNKDNTSSKIVMNEIYSRGTSTDPDWIEIYNGSSTAVDISNFKIYDSGAKGGTKSKKGFPTGAKIAAKGFYVIVTDGSNAEDFGLSSSGEAVWLEDSTGTIIDSVTFAAMETTQSYGRSPDGGDWKLLSTITKGAGNSTGTGVKYTENAPNGFVLNQNYPNPFNPSTVISYQISAKSHVTLKIYDVLGKEIMIPVNGEKQPGTYSVTIDAFSLAAGVYYYALSVDGYAQIKKMMLVK